MLQSVPLHFKIFLWEELFCGELLSLKEKIDAPTFTIARRNDPKFPTKLLRRIPKSASTHCAGHIGNHLRGVVGPIAHKFL
jgi:hypothetical protein